MTDEYITIIPEKRDEFLTGAKRGSEEGKLRYDLISLIMLERLAGVMTRGAAEYGEHNWEKGIPIKRFWSSAWRHFIAAQQNNPNDKEDHLAGSIFNLMAIMHTTELIKRGELSEELLK